MPSARHAISFRLLRQSDFLLLKLWLAEPHVSRWWREPASLAEIRAKYEPRITGAEPTHVFVFENCGRSAGFIQWYRWCDYPDHAQQLDVDADSAGIDIAIGERDMIGVGLGPMVIREFVQEIVFRDPGIRAVITDPEEANLVSLRAFEKAGFSLGQRVQLKDEPFRRIVVRLVRTPEATARDQR